MQKPTLSREIVLLLIVLSPLAYLGYLWNALPAQVPIHFNARGEADGYGDRTFLFLMTGVNLLTYLLLKYVPFRGRTARGEAEGNKFYRLRMILAVFLAVLNVGIIQSATSEAGPGIRIVMVGTCLMLAGLGNYMGTIRPNYYIGIRTPWTLGNEEVWKKTHRAASSWFFWGGLIGAIAGIFIAREHQVTVVLLLTLVLATVSMGYSYYFHRKLSVRS